MLSLGILTSIKRSATLVMSSPEDRSWSYFVGKTPKDAKIIHNDDRIERVRRNHLNDVENIYLFVLIGFFYVLTQPDLSTATWHFRIFTISRFIHTLVYQLAVKQPARGSAFFVGVLVNVSMAFSILFNGALSF
ncbi:DgyrCDS6707 [Dimorphilus gyrociliatus]|uniref:Microsomal glutathione S-transferase 1 n=1 Tax=Dimorphilus gyrociliatus TaxID=2664684 RepID=A0A7I8VQD9_9ANNE|nr:DgyrCDS6707 [Dimorphilus gyrociliatus]